MFKKRKEKKAAAAAAVQQQRDDLIANLQLLADGVTKDEKDPVARVEEYQKVQKMATDMVNSLAGAAEKKRTKSAELAGAGGMVAPLAVGAALAPLTGGISLAAGIVASLFTSPIGQIAGDEHATKKEKEENGSYVAALEKVASDVDTLITATLENNVEQILDSPNYERLTQNRAISARFNEASTKYFAELRQKQKDLGMVDEAAPAAKDKPAKRAEKAPEQDPELDAITALARSGTGSKKSPAKKPQPPKAA